MNLTVDLVIVGFFLPYRTRKKLRISTEPNLIGEYRIGGIFMNYHYNQVHYIHIDRSASGVSRMMNELPSFKRK
jgi:hypothetical protein